MNVDHCVSSNNGLYGFCFERPGHCDDTGGGSMATNNAVFGFVQYTGGTLESLVDNLVRGNTTNNTFGTITIVTGN